MLLVDVVVVNVMVDEEVVKVELYEEVELYEKVELYEEVEEGGKLYPRVGYFSWPAI